MTSDVLDGQRPRERVGDRLQAHELFERMLGRRACLALAFQQTRIFFGRSALLGDIARHDHDAAHVGIVEQVRRRRLHDAPGAVLVPGTNHTAHLLRVATDQVVEDGRHPRNIVWMDEFGCGALLPLPRVIA
ncbi:MAG TPA: hypothetical protein VGL99_03580 [Chloroflexota bacterium]